MSTQFSVNRYIHIQAPVETVFTLIADFANWQAWSPWLCQEPGCPISRTGEAGKIGHSQSWDGQQIGAGTITLNATHENKKLDYKLSFVRPWKSQSTSSFIFEPTEDGTQVTWSMQGQLPVFMFFMKKMMSAFVGSDYERGLSMLKEYAEQGSVPSAIEVNRVVEQPSFYYLGKHTKCRIPDIESSMEALFSNLTENGALPDAEFTGCFYHKFDLVAQECDYTAFFGYSEKPQISTSNAQLIESKVENHRALNINHLGPYRYLGNAWSALIGCSRYQKLKSLKKIPMYEIYETMPNQVPEPEVKTRLYFPVR